MGVALHDRFTALKWIEDDYALTPKGARAFEALGIDVDATQALRWRFAYTCLDWSERRPHVGGGLASEIFKIAMKRRWVIQDLDSRALAITAKGRREMSARFGVQF